MANDTLKTIGDAIRHERQQIQLTQEKAAFKAGISYRYFQAIETGKSSVGIRVLFRICRGVGCHYSAVLEKAWQAFKLL